MSSPGRPVRSGVRALVVDTLDRVLLVMFELPSTVYWAAPGGGVEPGESAHQALRRELAEETGLTDPVVGPEIWTRTETFPTEDRYRSQEERFFLVRTEPFIPRPLLSWEELRNEFVTAIRWWTLDELDTVDSLFAPPQLAHLAARIVADGPPTAPLDLDSR